MFEILEVGLSILVLLILSFNVVGCWIFCFVFFTFRFRILGFKDFLFWRFLYVGSWIRRSGVISVLFRGFDLVGRVEMVSWF